LNFASGAGEILDSADVAAGRISDLPAKGQNPWVRGIASMHEKGRLAAALFTFAMPMPY
jgi:hypothetical protein